MVLNINDQLINKRKLIFVLSIASAIFGQNSASAINFIVTPRLSLQEIYSDNIGRDPEGFEKGAFVTDISPGISLRGINGGRLTASLDYQLQALFNAGGDGSTRIFNQLQFDSGYVVSRRRLNIGLRSSIGQINTTNIRAGDNINDPDNRTNIYTVGTFANWTPHFGSFADAIVNVDFNYLANDDNNTNILSNSKNVRESVTLRSGRDFSRITWIANFNNSNEFRDNAEDVRQQQTQATIRGWVDRYFNFFATGGYANNSFQGLNNDTNGFFYTVGAQWRPNWWFNIEAGYGNNWHVTSNLSLSRRTRLSAGYFDRSIGLNTGGAWNASITHDTKRSFWRASYTEDTITQQDILENRNFLFDDGSNSQNNPAGSRGNVNSGFTLTNNVLVRKVADASVSYTTGKSVFQFGGSYQTRNPQNPVENEETVYGANASWNWNITRRINFFISPFWQHIRRSGNTTTSASDDDRYGFSTRMTRSLPLDIGRFGLLNASLEYQFLKVDSDLVLPNPPPGESGDTSYTENRVTLSLFMNF